MPRLLARTFAALTLLSLLSGCDAVASHVQIL